MPLNLQKSGLARVSIPTDSQGRFQIPLPYSSYFETWRKWVIKLDGQIVYLADSTEMASPGAVAAGERPGWTVETNIYSESERGYGVSSWLPSEWLAPTGYSLGNKAKVVLPSDPEFLKKIKKFWPDLDYTSLDGQVVVINSLPWNGSSLDGEYLVPYVSISWHKKSDSRRANSAVMVSWLRPHAEPSLSSVECQSNNLKVVIQNSPIKTESIPMPTEQTNSIKITAGNYVRKKTTGEVYVALAYEDVKEISAPCRFKVINTDTYKDNHFVCSTWACSDQKGEHWFIPEAELEVCSRPQFLRAAWSGYDLNDPSLDSYTQQIVENGSHPLYQWAGGVSQTLGHGLGSLNLDISLRLLTAATVIPSVMIVAYLIKLALI